MREIILPVISVRRASRSTRTVRLALDGRAFRFRPGQAAFVGPAERPERVPYSLACAPEEARRTGWLEFLIKVEASGRWGHLFDRVSRGHRVAVRGPFGSFVLPPRVGSRPLLFIAGGTGIAPIRAMIVHLLERRHRAMTLIYSARTSEDLAYAAELRRLARRTDLRVRLHATREAPDAWRGERGRISPAHLAPHVADRSVSCLVCGPEAMVAAVPEMLAALGVPRRQILLEQWKS